MGFTRPNQPIRPERVAGTTVPGQPFSGLRHSRGLGYLEFPPGALGVGRVRTGEGSPGEDPFCRGPRGWRLVGPRHPSREMSILRQEIRTAVLEIGRFSGNPKGRVGRIYMIT